MCVLALILQAVENSPLGYVAVGVVRICNARWFWVFSPLALNVTDLKRFMFHNHIARWCVSCCSVHFARSVTFQQINFSVAVRNFSISMSFEQPLTSGVTDIGEGTKLLVSVVWGTNLSSLVWSNWVRMIFGVDGLHMC